MPILLLLGVGVLALYAFSRGKKAAAVGALSEVEQFRHAFRVTAGRETVLSNEQIQELLNWGRTHGLMAMAGMGREWEVDIEEGRQLSTFEQLPASVLDALQNLYTTPIEDLRMAQSTALEAGFEGISAFIERIITDRLVAA